MGLLWCRRVSQLPIGRDRKEQWWWFRVQRMGHPYIHQQCKDQGYIWLHDVRCFNQRDFRKGQVKKTAWSPVNSEVLLLHILDDQCVPLHLVLLPGCHRLCVVFCILPCHRPLQRTVFLAALACQRPVLTHFSFYKNGLLFLVQQKTWSAQLTNRQNGLFLAHKT